MDSCNIILPDSSPFGTQNPKSLIMPINRKITKKIFYMRFSYNSFFVTSPAPKLNGPLDLVFLFLFIFTLIVFHLGSSPKSLGSPLLSSLSLSFCPKFLSSSPVYFVFFFFFFKWATLLSQLTLLGEVENNLPQQQQQNEKEERLPLF